MPDSCITLIDSLVAERKRQGLTQKEHADAAHLTQSVIARLESKRCIPNLDTLFRVVSALGCTLSLVPA